MVRRMADKDFHEQQHQDLYADHIRPINCFVEELRKFPGRGEVPYVAPMYGGINAKLLSVLSDPGPKTRAKEGSGFLSMENDDPSAERICNLFGMAGIHASDVMPWNAYPWYINRAPKVAELNAGVEPLKRMLDLLPKLRVVMLLGGSAHASWKKLIRSYPDIVVSRGLHVIKTYHTGRQALWSADPKVREDREAHLRQSFNAAARNLTASI